MNLKEGPKEDPGKYLEPLRRVRYGKFRLNKKYP
jgi:hypothetical protein